MVPGWLVVVNEVSSGVRPHLSRLSRLCEKLQELCMASGYKVGGPRLIIATGEAQKYIILSLSKTGQ